MPRKLVDNRVQIAEYLTKVFNNLTEPAIIKVMVMQRRKDPGNEGLVHPERIIKTYLVNSVDHMTRVFNEVEDLCNYFNARAYVNITPKSLKRCKWRLCRDLLDELEKNSTRNLNGVVDGVVDSAGGVGDMTTWLVDLDDISYYDEVKCHIKAIYDMTHQGKGDRDSLFVMDNPTVNGMHLIVNPFDISKFKKKDDVYDIKRNAPTLLYANLLTKQV